MPSVGPTEVLLVLVIALLVLGPHRLPELGRQLGRGIRQFREAARNITKEMGAEDLVEDLKGFNEARGTFGQTVRKELGLDELEPLPSLDEIGTDKPAAPAQSAAVPAATVAATVSTDVPVPAAPVTPVEAEPPVFVTDAPATDAPVETAPHAPTTPPPAPRKRTPRAAKAATPSGAPQAAPAPRKRTPKAAAVATSAEPKAAPAPRKRTPKAAVMPAPADQAAASQPAAPRPARKRTPKATTGDTA
jgi:TatA/E family protein of Tat protein translocase